MTLLQFRDILLTADPETSHYKSTQQPNYTVWKEYGDAALYADNQRSEEDKTWKIQVDRFTKIEFDPVVDSIRSALIAANISFDYLCDFEPDTGYMHHIFDCEAI